MNNPLDRPFALLADAVMCRMMNSLQWRLRSHVCSAAELDDYLDACANLTREEFFAPAPMDGGIFSTEQVLTWPSPFPGPFAENNTCRVEIFHSVHGPASPTVILLHALMSAHGKGYRDLGRRLAAAGWNVAFPHLPYHYSRKPQGFPNGAFAITANLVRNGETLRQAVVEMRQLMAWFRERGVRDFGLIGTSYGGWVGALLASVETDWQFVSLLTPIANVEKAIWDNPAAASIRKILSAQGIGRDAAARHAHLTSPLHAKPLALPSSILLCGSEFDTVSPIQDLERLATAWDVPRLLRVRQGHFGYRAMRQTLAELAPILGIGKMASVSRG